MGTETEVRWARFALAAAVLAIAFVTATQLTFLRVAVDEQPKLQWGLVTNWFTPFTFSTLFVASGVLLAPLLRQGYRSVALRRWLATAGMTYVIWLVVYVLLASEGVPGLAFKLPQYIDVLIGIVLANTPLWVLFALLFWSLLLPLLMRLPWWLTMPLLMALAVATWWMPPVTATDHYPEVLRYGAFVALGVLGRDRFISVLARRPLESFLCAATALIVVRSLLTIPALWTNELSRPSLAVGTVLSQLCAALAVVSLSAVLVQAPPLARPMEWVGARALPVYVVSFPLASLLSIIPGWTDLANLPGVATWLSTAAWAIIVIAALAIYEGVRRTPAWFVFGLDARPHRDALRSGAAVSAG